MNQMRTIKFRGKRVDTDKWIFGDLLTSNGTECEISDWNDIVYSRYDVIPNTVGQFTGLLDKNGKEIYEGDIMTVAGTCCVVEYSANGFYQVSEDITYCNFNGYAVIGNIHDNPELLKGGKE